MAKRKSQTVSSHKRRKPKRPARTPMQLARSTAKKIVPVHRYTRRKP